MWKPSKPVAKAHPLPPWEVTPVYERYYKLKTIPGTLPHASKQRRIILEVLVHATKPLQIIEIAHLAHRKGLNTDTPDHACVRHHLHYFLQKGIAEEIMQKGLNDVETT